MWLAFGLAADSHKTAGGSLGTFPYPQSLCTFPQITRFFVLLSFHVSSLPNGGFLAPGVLLSCALVSRPFSFSMLVTLSPQSLPRSAIPIVGIFRRELPKDCFGHSSLTSHLATSMLSCMLDAMLYCHHHNPFSCIVAILWS